MDTLSYISEANLELHKGKYSALIEICETRCCYDVVLSKTQDPQCCT